MPEWGWLLLLGVGTGTFGVLLGVGGGILLVPALLLFSGTDAAVVAGTSLALVSVNSFAGSAAYLRRRLVDRRSGLIFGAAAVPGSIAGPFAVDLVADDPFRVLFGLMLLSLGVFMLVRSRFVREKPGGPKHRIQATVRRRHLTPSTGEVFDYEFNEGLAAVFNMVVGFISAFFGTGGGFIRTPVLVSVFGFPVRVAVATSIFTMSIYATAGALVHALLSHVEWYPTFVWAGIGLVIGSQIGALVAIKIRSLWIVRLLTIVLLTLGGRLVIQGLFG